MMRKMIGKMIKVVMVVSIISNMFCVQSWAGSEPFIGEITMFAGNFAPRGWAFCDGQTLQISQNTALFSILGTTYGGNGQTTFQLPDLRQRVPVHKGQASGMTAIDLGEMGGSQTTILTTNQLPAHTHTAQVQGTATGTINCTNDMGNTPLPENNVLARGERNERIYSDKANPEKNLGGVNIDIAADNMTATIGNTGSGQPIDNMQPYIGINYIIAVEGLYPPRS